MKFDREALELLSILLCTFENSSKCVKASFDSDSFLEWPNGLLFNHCLNYSVSDGAQSDSLLAMTQAGSGSETGAEGESKN